MNCHQRYAPAESDQESRLAAADIAVGKPNLGCGRRRIAAGIGVRGGDSCKASYGLQWELKAAARERIETFKRLCDPVKVRAYLETLVASDKAKPAASAEDAKQQAARAANLAALKG